MIAQHQNMFRQNDFTDDSSQEIVWKILHRVEQDVQDSFNHVTALAPGYFLCNFNRSRNFALIFFAFGKS